MRATFKEKYRFPRSLNGWFVAHVIAVILISLAMGAAFMRFAGIWSNPPLEKFDQIMVVTGIAKALNRAPAAQRPELAQRLSTRELEIGWFPDRRRLPIPETRDAQDGDIWPRIREHLNHPGAGIVTIDPDDPEWREFDTPPAERFYALAIRLEDASWLLFRTEQRLWGLSSGARFLLASLFVLLSTLFIAWIFGLRVARPMRLFTRAVERFGISARAQPLELHGPQELREAIGAFNAMQAQIRELMESRVALFSAISHDLRTPLTRLKLRSEFIGDDAQRRKIVRDIGEIQAMVEGALAYFRLDVQPEEMTRLELSELLHTVVDDFRDMGKAVAYQPRDRIVLQGQPVALKRAVTNLLDNAVKYGGSDVVLTLSADPEHIRITVQDAGPGVPEAWLPRLFEPFYRGEPSRNQSTGGYGLGLAASRSIVRFHGGELTIANRQPRGLVATIRLPRHGPFAPASGASPTP